MCLEGLPQLLDMAIQANMGTTDNLFDKLQFMSSILSPCLSVYQLCPTGRVIKATFGREAPSGAMMTSRVSFGRRTVTTRGPTASMPA